MGAMADELRAKFPQSADTRFFKSEEYGMIQQIKTDLLNAKDKLEELSRSLDVVDGYCSVCEARTTQRIDDHIWLCKNCNERMYDRMFALTDYPYRCPKCKSVNVADPQENGWLICGDCLHYDEASEFDLIVQMHKHTLYLVWIDVEMRHHRLMEYGMKIAMYRILSGPIMSYAHNKALDGLLLALGSEPIDEDRILKHAGYVMKLIQNTPQGTKHPIHFTVENILSEVAE